MTKPMMIRRITIRPLLNMKYFGLTRHGMLLIAICLTRGVLRIRTFPDFGLRIQGFLIGGCLYTRVGRPEIPTMAGLYEVDKILGVDT